MTTTQQTPETLAETAELLINTAIQNKCIIQHAGSDLWYAVDYTGKEELILTTAMIRPNALASFLESNIDCTFALKNEVNRTVLFIL